MNMKQRSRGRMTDGSQVHPASAEVPCDSGWGGVETPFGRIAIRWQDGALTAVDLEPEGVLAAGRPLPPAVAERITAYLCDGSAPLDLPVDLRGTPFQRRVWRALQAIPAGRTATYGELARVLGTSARAVGGACRANPCPILVPCHRVVAKQGLGGFAGDRSGRKLAIKRWLLRHEGVALDVGRPAAENVDEPKRVRPHP